MRPGILSPKPSTASNPCDECGARCCKKFLIAPTASDIARLSSKLGTAAPEFLEAFPAEKCACVHAPSFWVDGKEIFIGLKRKKGACLFLRGNACSVHNFKPLVCRTFPFCLNKYEVEKSSFCGKDVLMEKDGKSLIERYERELKLMRRDAVEWNWRTGGERGLGQLATFMQAKARERAGISRIISKLKF